MPTRTKGAATDLGVLRDDIGRLSTQLLGTQRHLCRLLVALGGGDPAMAAARYKDQLTEEKRDLVKLLERQCHELCRLRAPLRVLRSRERDLKRARRALRKLEQEEPEDLWHGALKSVRLSLADYNLSLSTRFVDTHLYDHLMNDADGRRWIDAQIES